MKGFNRGNQSRLPIILAASIGVFGVMTIAIALASLKKNGQAAQADTDKRDRVVVVEKEAPIEMTDVLVPVSDIEQGKKLELTMFRIEKKAKLALGPSAVKSPEEIKNQYARSFIPAGNPLNREVMTPIRPANPVIASIPAGFRAVTISVNALSAVEGWATAGALVDVQWITNQNGQKQATIIVENAKVLSAERQLENNGPNGQQQTGQPIPTTVTLLVSERDAQRIGIASTDGMLTLLLRGATDIGKGSATEGALTLKDLFGKGRGLNDADAVLKVKNPDGTYREIKLKDGKILRDE